jgi:hypothetical protein
VVRRVFDIQQTPSDESRTVPDDLPRDMLFAQPLTCEISGRLEATEDGHRAVFRVLVKDDEGKRCPDLAVETRIDGPHRAATGQTTTNMLGVATFRMGGPAGLYTAEVLDVAAHALAWDRDASTLTARAG